MNDSLVDKKWRRFDGRRIEQPIKEAVRAAIQREHDLGHRLKVCIGTDSQVHGKTVEFATVIVFLREKKGGFMFIANYSEKKQLSLRERMIMEVARSVDIAYNLCDLLDEHEVALEVHADINTDPHFESNVALKEAMGYILGMGFVFKAKPEAFASSSCADKVV
ncbi:MAG: ribonuclease H-like YkuK family protein [Bacteroidota bacterium]